MATYSFRVPLSAPSFLGNERRYVDECFESSQLSSVGRFLGDFEAALANAIGAPDAVAVQSGTAGLHLALVALGIGAGDEVWVSDLTFIASANPVVHCGAQVVLVDSEPETGNVDVSLLLAELDRRVAAGALLPRAIIPVHLAGHVARVDLLVDRAHDLGIAVIEDATESLGGRWTGGSAAGRSVGTLGTVAVFSFNGNKLLSTGGGGMVVSADSELLGRIRHLSTQAKLPGLEYRHDAAGFNYRLTNLAAAVGLAQVERLDEIVAAKRSIARRYAEGFAGSDIVGPLWPNDVEPAHWLSTVRVRDRVTRDAALDMLHREGFEARALWPPLHEQAPYRDAAVIGGSVAADVSYRSINLPSSVGLEPADQDAIIALLTKAG